MSQPDLPSAALLPALPRLTWRHRIAAAALLFAAAGPALADGRFGDAIDTARDAENDPAGTAARLSKGPKGPPQKLFTGFDEPLRCMDRLLATYGVRNVTLVIEEIPDTTGKVKAGARDMFISATSRMTQRSRAIRLVPYEQASVAFKGRGDFLTNGAFVLQGSVSQLDESIVKRQRDGSICLGPFCLGVATSDTYNALGLDLNVIRASDLTLIPGVTARNSVLVVKHGAGADGELNINKFGFNFNLVYATSDGAGQALRSLVELGAIELYGKLLKLPYWSCLGGNSGNSEVSSEIEDWWEALSSDPGDLVAWVQVQMTARGLYQGPVDGTVSDELLRALQTYKRAMGQPDNAEINLAFLRAYYDTDHAKVEQVARKAMPQAPVAAAGNAMPAGSAVAVPVAALDTKLRQGAAATSGDPGPAGSAGEPVRIVDHAGPRAGYRSHEYYQFDVQVNMDGFLYCWLVDEAQAAHQFFPMPGADSGALALRSGATVAFPGQLGIKFFAPTTAGSHETIACGVAGSDLGPEPIKLAKGARVDVSVMRTQFARLAGAQSGFGAYDVNVK